MADYLDEAAVEAKIAALAASYASTCTLITLPHATHEGRTCHAIRLGGGPPGSRDCVMIIGGVHAREWGSPEIAVNLATDLLEAYAGNSGLGYGTGPGGAPNILFTAPQIQNLLNTLHIIVFPLVNPDGRRVSRTKENEDWRMNRRPKPPGSPADCQGGVDINRNYDFLWDVAAKFAPGSAGAGSASSDPCGFGQTYKGPSPFSEPETQNVKWLLDTNPRTHWFLDLHSSGQTILVNWGDDDVQSADPKMNFQNPAFNSTRGVLNDTAYREYMPADDIVVRQTLAEVFRDALQKVRGSVYTIPGPSGNAATGKDYVYSRNFVDPSKGKIYGYTIEWGTTFHPEPWSAMVPVVEEVTAGLIAFCLEAPCAAGLKAIAQMTPVITFNDVPAGVETSRAAVFSVQSCSAIDLTVTSGPSVTSGPGGFGLPLGGASLPPAPTALDRELRVWVSFKGTSPGDVTKGTITIHCVQTGKDFIIPILANTIAQPKVASMLVLDKSGSMGSPSGIPGKQRIDVLHDAAPTYITLLPDTAGIGLIGFDHDAAQIMPVDTAGPSGSMVRGAANTGISNHVTNPSGLTAIGDGVELAHNKLEPLAGYAHKAIVVFTDGFDTEKKAIDDVAAIIKEQVFAIGLGTVWEVNPVALNKLVNNTGGYLLMTDALGPNDSRRLSKYFVQILAGVTNTEIVIDPEGIVAPGIEVRIPFDLNSNDYAADAIALSPAPWTFEFQLETPDGLRIDHSNLTGVIGVEFVTGPQLAFYRFMLPVFVDGRAAYSGRWHVVLKIRNLPARLAGVTTLGVPYTVVVQAQSSLCMAASVTQPSNQPPTKLILRAVLTEIGLPVEHRAKVEAEITRPDGTKVSETLIETEPGVFEGSSPAALAGVYPVRFRGWGKTLRGYPFTREQLRTGMAWYPGHVQSTDPAPHRPWASFLKGLTSLEVVHRWLKEQNVEPADIEKLIDEAFGRRRTNDDPS